MSQWKGIRLYTIIITVVQGYSQWKIILLMKNHLILHKNKSKHSYKILLKQM